MSEAFKVKAVCPHGLEVLADAEVGTATRNAIITFPVCDHTDVVGDTGVIHELSDPEHAESRWPTAGGAEGEGA